MKMLIPTQLLQEIQNKVSIIPLNITQEQEQKLIQRLVELWLHIYERQINDVTTQNLNYWVNIPTDDLKNFQIQFGKIKIYYSQMLTFLWPTIEINDKYLQNVFTKSYRVSTDFLKDTNFTEIEIDFTKVMFGYKSKDYWINLYPKQENLINDAYNTQVNLDSYLNWLKQNVGTPLTPKFDKKSGKLIKRVLTPDRVISHFMSALKLNFKNLWFKLSNEGRFYSSISNLPKTSLEFVTLYGHNTKSIDIKNCQPLLLTLLINNETYKGDCQEGLFYESVLNGFPLGGKPLDRNVVKLMCYKHIFFGKRVIKSGILYDSLEKVYPGLIQQINTIKESGCLSKTLQSKESDIFVQNIGRIKLPKLLRHDEVVVQVKDYELMKEYLIKEFKKLGLSIKLS